MLDFHEGPGGRIFPGISWPACQGVRHQNASKTCTLSQKVGRKRVPLGRKSTSKPFIIWDTKMRQKREPLARKSVENAYP